MELSLHKLKCGTKAEIIGLSDDAGTKSKLTSLGILIGDQIEIVSKVILGGPISCRHQTDTFFSLRKNYAKNITVKVVQ